MEISEELRLYIIEKGLVLAAIYFSLKLLSWRLDKNIWLGELSDGQQKGNQKAYILYMVIFFGSLVAYLNYIDQQLIALNSSFSQFSLFIVNVMIYSIYIFANLLVHDFLIYSRLQPKLMAFETLEFVNSPFHHLKYNIRWMVVGAVFCFLASVISLL